MKRIEGNHLAAGQRVAVIATRWNHFIVDRLVEGAETAFVQAGGNREDLTLYVVPGALELPLVAKRVAAAAEVDAVVCVGAVIRGATSHYEVVVQGASSGAAHVALDTGVPVTLGLLTTDTLEQSIERAGTKAGNKGHEAMLAAIEMVSLLKHIS